MNVVNIAGMVIRLVTYDDHMTLEECPEENVLNTVNTDLILGRLIPIIRHPICDGACVDRSNSQQFWLYG